MFVSFGSFSLFIWRLNLVLKDRQQLVIPVASEDRFVDAASLVGPEDYHYPKKPAPIWIYSVVIDGVEVRFVVVNGLVALLQNWHLLLAHHRRLCLEPMVIEYHCRLVSSTGSDRTINIGRWTITIGSWHNHWWQAWCYHSRLKPLNRQW
jgi:hypothetical protein